MLGSIPPRHRARQPRWDAMPWQMDGQSRAGGGASGTRCAVQLAMDNLNLSNDRSERSVWDDPGAGLLGRLQSLDTGRSLVVAGAAAVAAVGLRKRGVFGALLTATGGLLLYRALTGHDDVMQARTWSEERLRQRGWLGQNDVDEAVEESFPASDPPSH